MKKIKILLVGMLFPLIAFSWNGSGHMTGGAITYYYLKSHNPIVLKKVIATLKLHPWYNSARWHDRLAGLNEEQQNVALFMLASIYPDEARTIPELGGGVKKTWHYINYPYVPAGQTVQARPAPVPNAELKIVEYLNTLPNFPEIPDKAVDIAWLLHLIEDIHQPLHTIALFDNNHLAGDKGGNSTYIQFKTNAPIAMHTYWDGLIKGNYVNIAARAQQLLSTPQLSEPSLRELNINRTVKEWMTKESVPLAIDFAYEKGAVAGTKTAPSVVNEKYLKRATIIAQKRIVLAGIRLAKSLIKIYA